MLIFPLGGFCYLCIWFGLGWYGLGWFGVVVFRGSEKTCYDVVVDFGDD